MRTLIALSTFALAGSLVSSSIAQKTATTRQPTPAAVWQEQDWPKWKMKFSIPPKWRLFKELTEDRPDQVDGYNGFHQEERRFTREPKGPNEFPDIDLSITVTTWNGPTYNAKGPTRVVKFTPEEFMAAEQGTPELWVIGAPGVENTRYKEIGGWKGVYTNYWPGAILVGNEKRGPNNEIAVVWTGYRLFEGNIQRIKIDVTGKRKEVLFLDRILDTFSIQ